VSDATLPRVSRVEWLREEIRTTRHRLERLLNRDAADPWTQSTRSRLEQELADAEQQLAVALGGGALRLRLSGGAVFDNTVKAAALASIVRPIEELAESYGGELFVGQSQPGSYVVSLLPSPQLDLFGEAPIEAIGSLMAQLSSSAQLADTDAEVDALAETLSLDSVRSLISLMRGVVDHGLDVGVTWIHPSGRQDHAPLSQGAANRLLLALRNADVERQRTEVVGDLLMADISARPRFAIRDDAGVEYRGSVPRDIAAGQLKGIPTGTRVTATVETIQTRLSSTPTMRYRLLRIELGH
jgi:hypothetical protein